MTVTYDVTDDKKTPVVSVTPTTVKLFSAAYTRIEGLVGTYTAGTGADVGKGTVTFTNNSSGTPANTDIVVTANVANIGTDSETWTALTLASDPKNTYFYYNNDVEEGDSTAKLVDSVKLADDTKKSAYLALDFDLNVILDSVQVTVAEDGKEDITAAKSEWTQINKTGTVAAYDNNSNEIKSITWVQS